MQIDFTELIRVQNDKSYLYDELTRCTCLEDNNLVRISLTLAELAVFVFLFFVFLFFVFLFFFFSPVSYSLMALSLG